MVWLSKTFMGAPLERWFEVRSTLSFVCGCPPFVVAHGVHCVSTLRCSALSASSSPGVAAWCMRMCLRAMSIHRPSAWALNWGSHSSTSTSCWSMVSSANRRCSVVGTVVASVLGLVMVAAPLVCIARTCLALRPGCLLTPKTKGRSDMALCSAGLGAGGRFL